MPDPSRNDFNLNKWRLLRIQSAVESRCRGHLLFFCALFLMDIQGLSQSGTGTVHQLNGQVLQYGNLKPIPFATLVKLGSSQGTIADGGGSFRLVVRSLDTVQITAVGFKPATYVVPDSLPQIFINTGFLLASDTVLLDPVEINPWPDESSFKRAFVELEEVFPEDLVSDDAGFTRLDNPVEPAPTAMNPASLFYEKVIVAIKNKKRKRKKSKQLPKMK